MIAIALLAQVAAVAFTDQQALDFPSRKPEYEIPAHDESLNKLALKNLVQTTRARRSDVIDIRQNSGPSYSVVTITYIRPKNPRMIDQMNFIKLIDGRVFMQIMM